MNGPWDIEQRMHDGQHHTVAVGYATLEKAKRAAQGMRSRMFPSIWRAVNDDGEIWEAAFNPPVRARWVCIQVTRPE